MEGGGPLGGGPRGGPPTEGAPGGAEAMALKKKDMPGLQKESYSKWVDSCYFLKLKYHFSMVNNSLPPTGDRAGGGPRGGPTGNFGKNRF